RRSLYENRTKRGRPADHCGYRKGFAWRATHGQKQSSAGNSRGVFLLRMTNRRKNVEGYHTFADLQKPFSFTDLFGNENPVELEIGAGRGDFLVGSCAEHPGINLAAVERKLAYLARGINKARNSG